MLATNQVNYHEEIIKLIKARDYYSHAQVRAIFFQDQDRWLNALTLIILQHTHDERVVDEFHHYGTVTLARLSIPITEFTDLLDNLITNNELRIRECPLINIYGQLSQAQPYGYIASDDTHLQIGWAANVYTFVDQQQQRTFPSIPDYGLAVVDAPLYPGFDEVVKGWIGCDISRTRYSKGVIILLPNYDARIGEVILGTDTLTVNI